MPLRPTLHPRIIRRILRTEQIPFQLRPPIRALVQIPPTAFPPLRPRFQFVPVAAHAFLSDSTDGLGRVGRVPWCVVGVADGVFPQRVETVHVVLEGIGRGDVEVVFHEGLLEGFLGRGC